MNCLSSQVHVSIYLFGHLCLVNEIPQDVRTTQQMNGYLHSSDAVHEGYGEEGFTRRLLGGLL